ncbi:hypothetical protein GQR58_011970 [Nymphon striatum]|nr:hypothetical protein GQR58_011970 [Nymphon striatum]
MNKYEDGSSKLIDKIENLLFHSTDIKGKEDCVRAYFLTDYLVVNGKVSEHLEAILPKIVAGEKCLIHFKSSSNVVHSVQRSASTLPSQSAVYCSQSSTLSRAKSDCIHFSTVTAFKVCFLEFDSTYLRTDFLRSDRIELVSGAGGISH